MKKQHRKRPNVRRKPTQAERKGRAIILTHSRQWNTTAQGRPTAEVLLDMEPETVVVALLALHEDAARGDETAARIILDCFERLSDGEKAGDTHAMAIKEAMTAALDMDTRPGAAAAPAEPVLPSKAGGAIRDPQRL
jgi:hypothetical protein